MLRLEQIQERDVLSPNYYLPKVLEVVEDVLNSNERIEPESDLFGEFGADEFDFLQIFKKVGLDIEPYTSGGGINAKGEKWLQHFHPYMAGREGIDVEKYKHLVELAESKSVQELIKKLSSLDIAYLKWYEMMKRAA